MPIQPAPVADGPQIVALCDIATAPQRFAGRRITVRGALYLSHPESFIGLVDQGCTSGLQVNILSDEAARRLRLSTLRVTYATLTGIMREAPCDGRRPPGSGCGPYLAVDQAEAVTETDLCWTTIYPSPNRPQIAPGPCLDAPARR